MGALFAQKLSDWSLTFDGDIDSIDIIVEF